MTEHANELRRHAGKIGRNPSNTPAVMRAAATMLPEMRTGRRAIIESSVSDPRCWDIVFDDGTDAPFCISLDKRQLDRTLTTGRGVLTVWVPTGKTLELPLEICV